jgi:hypothetical protein
VIVHDKAGAQFLETTAAGSGAECPLLFGEDIYSRGQSPSCAKERALTWRLLDDGFPVIWK